jgi:asparagine synthase (glutamine-hydrolysing)
MVQCMMHEPFYASGTFSQDRLGLQIGWVNHKGSFADCLPIWNETKDVVLVFSGEDFADPEDIRLLRAAGHDFAPGNASYLVHLYEEKGDGFFGSLNGRFSGLIIDLREHRSILFNDRYGLDRVYFTEGREGFYFSSEAKSLLAVFPELRRLDERSLGEVFSCGSVLQNRTLFSGLSLMPGGSRWTFVPGNSPRKESYFRPETWEEQAPLSGEDYYRRLRETWIRILPRYLRGRERVAVSLTGGKDSRMIMAWAGASPGTLPSYTFGGMYRESRDVKLARSVARSCGQAHQVIPVDRPFLDEFPSLAERTIFLSDGTMDVSGSVELYVNRSARQIAPVRLTGNYGQEILRGAVAFRPSLFDKCLLQSEFAATVEDSAATYRSEIGRDPLTFVAFKQVPWHHYARLAIELSQLTVRSPFLDNDLVALAYQAPSETATGAESQIRLIAEGNPDLGRIRTDRGLSGTSLSPRTKARQLLEAFTVKAEYAYDYGMPQWLAFLDHAVRPLHLERLFLGRHKFAHFRIWYREALAAYVKGVLLDPRALGRPYLDGRNVEKRILAHVEGTRNYTSEIHRLLSVELIQRQFTD